MGKGYDLFRLDTQVGRPTAAMGEKSLSSFRLDFFISSLRGAQGRRKLSSPDPTTTPPRLTRESYRSHKVYDIQLHTNAAKPPS